MRLRIWQHWGVGALLLAGCGGGVMHLGETESEGGTTAGAAGSAAENTDGAARLTGGSLQGGGAGAFSAGGSSVVGGAPSAGGSASDSTVDAAAGVAGGSSGVACSLSALPVSQPRPLTSLEYDRTVYDLLGDVPPTPRKFDESIGDSGFRPASSDAMMPVLVDEFARAADDVAARATADINALLQCPVGSEQSDDCALSFVVDLAGRAFRRPLTTSETAAVRTQYATARGGSTVEVAVRRVIGWTLRQSAFYLVESGTAGSFGLLEPYALASRLSYFLTRTMPDRELLAAASAGQLVTATQVEQQARRLLATPGAHAAIADFFTQWLLLDQLANGEVDKDAAMYPTFVSLTNAMKTETLLFADQVVFTDGHWPSLLNNPTTFVNDVLASLYGLTVTGSDFRQVKVDGSKQRFGLLTQGSFLSIFAGSIQGSPVRRGAFVRRHLLCDDIPPPPPNVPALPSAPAETNRQLFVAHTNNPACATCHRLMDPIGFGLENYDAIGQYMATDHGMPVDATGTLVSMHDGADIPFDDAQQLSRVLSSLPQVGECIATQFFRYAVLRHEDNADTCSVVAAENALRDGTFQDMLVAIANSPSFRYARW